MHADSLSALLTGSAWAFMVNLMVRCASLAVTLIYSPKDCVCVGVDGARCGVEGHLTNQRSGQCGRAGERGRAGRLTTY